MKELVLLHRPNQDRCRFSRSCIREHEKGLQGRPILGPRSRNSGVLLLSSAEHGAKSPRAGLNGLLPIFSVNITRLRRREHPLPAPPTTIASEASWLRLQWQSNLQRATSAHQFCGLTSCSFSQNHFTQHQTPPPVSNNGASFDPPSSIPGAQLPHQPGRIKPGSRFCASFEPIDDHRSK